MARQYCKDFEKFRRSKDSRQISSTNFQNDALKNIFIRYDIAATAAPSAAVERVFTLRKDALKPKRAGLNGDHFKMLIFLEVNAWLLATLFFCVFLIVSFFYKTLHLRKKKNNRSTTIL